jgi:hypothetical protein
VNNVNGAQAWVVAGDATGTYDAHLLTIAAPVTAPPNQQCGKLVFSSEEAVGTMTSASSPWPASSTSRCPSSRIGGVGSRRRSSYCE